MCENSLNGKREIPSASAEDGKADRSEKVADHNADMNADGKSDDRIVPKNPPNNKAQDAFAEVAEQRRSTEGNSGQTTTPRTLSRTSVSSGLYRVREANASTPNTRSRSRMR